MPRKIIFEIREIIKGEKFSLTADFTDEELTQLEDYVKYVRELAQTRLGRYGFTSRLNIEMKKDGEEWDTLFESTIPNWDDIMAFLHRLRPLILKKEHASFEKVCGLIGKRLNNSYVRDFIKQQRFLYSGESFQSQMRIKVDDTIINSDTTLMKWLNACEYHRDKEKKAEIDFLMKMIPSHSLETLFIMHIADKADAIRNVCKLAMTILQTDGSRVFEFKGNTPISNLIVIDKSWLQGVSVDQVKKLAANKKLLFTAALGYEIFTDDESERVDCWKKLKIVEKSLLIVDHVGSFLMYESDNQVPCTPITTLTHNVVKLSPDLANSNYQFSSQHRNDLDYFENEWEVVGVELFKKTSATANALFPELNEIGVGSRIEDVQPLMRKIVADTRRIKEVYRKISEIKPEFFPPADKIDENWAFFRWVQVHVLASVEYIRKYGVGNTEMMAKGLVNDNIDLDYCITGILSGALATHDNRMKLYFRLCRPDGLLIE